MPRRARCCPGARAPLTVVNDTIQAGIYHRSGERPPGNFRLVLANAQPGTTALEFSKAIHDVALKLRHLAAGRVPELEGLPESHARATRSQFADLGTVIAFGRRLFDPSAHDPPLTRRERPAYLSYLDKKEAFPSLAWTPEPRPGECDLALQLTAGSAAAVNCAAVEVWKAIDEWNLPLVPVATYDGFARLDGRGWLEFHDGVSNIASSDRPAAIVADSPNWMRGGTFMAFLRVKVDLRAWRSLGRRGQELAVGRDKLTGAALEEVREGRDGELMPVPRRFDPGDPEASADWRDPSQTTDPRLERSHIHRANQSRTSPAAPAGFRMFRQGYEFLENIGPGGADVGLNFVSFQRDLRAFHQVMHLPGWLGDTAFGGDAPDSLLTLEAGGFYAAPAVGEPFPGHKLFDSDG